MQARQRQALLVLGQNVSHNLMKGLGVLRAKGDRVPGPSGARCRPPTFQDGNVIVHSVELALQVIPLLDRAFQQRFPVVQSSLKFRNRHLFHNSCHGPFSHS